MFPGGFWVFPGCFRVVSGFSWLFLCVSGWSRVVSGFVAVSWLFLGVSGWFRGVEQTPTYDNIPYPGELQLSVPGKHTTYCSVCVKDNTLKPEPFHRGGLCCLLSLYKSFSFLRVIFVRVPPTTFLQCGLLGLYFLSFWPFGPSFPFILAFWAVISFHFGLLNLPKKPSGQDLG